MAQHNELGKLGESLAVSLLLQKGYRILEQNYCYQKAEVDIIAQKEALLVVVEVKTRSDVLFGDPQDFVNPKKIKLLVKAMDAFVCEKELDMEIRFDIIAVTKTTSGFELEHLEDAFYFFQ